MLNNQTIMNSSYGKIKIYPRLIEKFREIYTGEKICWNFELIPRE